MTPCTRKLSGRQCCRNGTQNFDRSVQMMLCKSRVVSCAYGQVRHALESSLHTHRNHVSVSTSRIHQRVHQIQFAITLVGNYLVAHFMLACISENHSTWKVFSLPVTSCNEKCNELFIVSKITLQICVQDKGYTSRRMNYSYIHL